MGIFKKDEGEFLFYTEEELNNLTDEERVVYALQVQNHLKIGEENFTMKAELEEFTKERIILFVQDLIEKSEEVLEETTQEEYGDWSREELVSEVSRLNAEVRQLNIRLTRAKSNGVPRGMGK